MQVTAAKRFLKLRAGVNWDGVTSDPRDIFGCDHTRRDRVDANAARAKHEREVLATRMFIAANLPNDGFGLGRCAAIVHQDFGAPLG